MKLTRGVRNKLFVEYTAQTVISSRFKSLGQLQTELVYTFKEAVLVNRGLFGGNGHQLDPQSIKAIVFRTWEELRDYPDLASLDVSLLSDDSSMTSQSIDIAIGAGLGGGLVWFVAYLLYRKFM
uniref:Uncharacterized protein n=2 Tax=Ciona intestinalis TaxID=7719 RepID=F7BKZ0_CIOIN